jgi:glycosyltransferase involved in cell wall biosynthesis
MKQLDQIIQKFNTEDTYIVISDYPESGKKGEKNYGIAWHTKEILEPMATRYKKRFVVLAEKGYDNKPRTYARGKILVLRVFDQEHPTIFPRILRWLGVFNKVNNIHIHSEFSARGGIKNFLFIVPFIYLIRSFGKTITYYTHNIVLDVNSVADHMNLEKGSLMVKGLNFAMKMYYKTLNLVVDQFVVMDGIIKKRLAHFVPRRKIVNLPFWIKPATYPLTQSQAKKKLGFTKDDFVIVSFGFISYYKGSDWVLRMVQRLKKNPAQKRLKLVLAGGEAYSLKDKDYYKKYYQNIAQKAEQDTAITLTGYVKEKDIGLYFTAADLVVLPYRGLIGASGTLSMAMTYGKPFLMSKRMSELLKSADFIEALEEAGLTRDDVTFAHTTDSFTEAITRAERPNVKKSLTKLSKVIAQKRSFPVLVEKCYNEIHNDQPQNTAQKANTASHKALNPVHIAGTS